MKKLLSLLTVGIVVSSIAMAAPQAGQPAPGFTLTDAAGKSVSLADYKGKYVVLEWINFGCPFVRKHYETGNMQKLQKEETAKGVVWLSICSSGPGKEGNLTPAEIQAKCKELGWAGNEYLIDADGTVGKLYGARTTPDMFVINPDGTLVYSGAIDNQPTPDHASVDGADNYVRDALNEVLAGKPVTTATTRSYGCSVKY